MKEQVFDFLVGLARAHKANEPKSIIINAMVEFTMQELSLSKSEAMVISLAAYNNA